MSKLQVKAQAQVKQMVGQMIGDDRLVQEGREQQHNADQAERTRNGDLKDEESRSPSGGPKSDQTRRDHRPKEPS